MRNRTLGRIHVYLVVLLLIASEALSYYINTNYSREELPTQYARIVYTVPILICMILGFGWTRWFAGISFLLGLLGITIVVLLLWEYRDRRFIVYSFIAMFFAYIYGFWAMLLSNSVKAYYRYCRRKRAER